MSILDGPFEYWDMESGETRTIQVHGYTEGQALIKPRYNNAPATKRIPVIRLLLTAECKEFLPSYWDISSKHLQAALKPYLNRSDIKELKFTITKIGSPPRTRYTMTVEKP